MVATAARLAVMLVLLAMAARCRGSEYAGRYLVVLDRWWDCELGEHGFDGSISHHLRFERFNPYQRRRVQAWFGNVTYSLPYDDSYWNNTTLAYWNNNQWKDNALVAHIPRRACSTIRSTSLDFFRHVTGDANRTDCLIPAGTYVFSGQRIDRRLSRVATLPYGRYRRLTLGGLVGRPEVRLCNYGLLQVLPDVPPPPPPPAPPAGRVQNRTV